MKKKALITIVLSTMLVCGCKQVSGLFPFKKRKIEVKEPVIKKVKNLELAKLILKPKRPKLDVTRDPFKPLVSKDAKKSGEDDEIKSLEGLMFVGVININDEYLVLLRTKSKKGVFKLRDKIKDFTIEDIQQDMVKLSNGIRTITLKRGVAR